jgi:hypothetical protein
MTSEITWAAITFAQRFKFQGCRLWEAGRPKTDKTGKAGTGWQLSGFPRSASRRLRRSQLRARLVLKSSYGLDKTLSQTKVYDYEGIKQAYDRLLKTDLAIKTGKYSDKLALEHLVTELASLQLLCINHYSSLAPPSLETQAKLWKRPQTAKIGLCPQG